MKERVVSGMRPTGRLHIGHFHGVLENWIRIQDQMECFFFVADWHSLTTEYADTAAIRDNIREMVLDWVAFGLDPEKTVVFRQSLVPHHAELNLILSMITPVSWLERNPTFKEMLDNIQQRDLSTFGFLGYPVLMAADIILYKATRVPVGQDQLPHLEITREIARRFNHLYGQVFPEPAALLTETPKLLGLDGRKMSKSYNNSIYLSDTAEETEKKIKSMMTDPARMRRSDAGDPEVCVAFNLHRIYVPQEQQDEIVPACRNASIGCVECKKILAKYLNERLAPFRAKRVELTQKSDFVDNLLHNGSKRASVISDAVMAEARAALKL
ncbi:tryptophan--tRNA ligase [Pelobacter propionicus]|uniref:Tryptophan--tRNA ligase n=1 Tax=Pelobacter propionicus (strain DSM 2379 / NBRC 103807 / OttBd1) TaxID=338966 RepID=A1APN0_PELPD|nr:tryptophan--tRNA ligase [Pelobacter propionicus]ABK99300.1 tryptophanyl-tRNA synthetase [Pelobacter propionicus DSM 2379]